MKPNKINKSDLERVTKYHIIFSNKQWKFKKENKSKSVISCKDKSTLITEAIYFLSNKGGYCYVHKESGEIDFLMSNWYG